MLITEAKDESLLRELHEVIVAIARGGPKSWPSGSGRLEEYQG